MNTVKVLLNGAQDNHLTMLALHKVSFVNFYDEILNFELHVILCVVKINHKV